ncbi:MAG TPA: DUF4388 domain-containing protein [Acidimicrobiia bacterium]|nr:DUF4388 domain-containing protein [Acidimicrobiia bacterium]
MALTGNIEVFPLPEVLRLLARSGKNGCLRIETSGVDGRIYLHEGALALATVSLDVDFLDQAIASGIIDPSRVEGRDPVSLPEALVESRTAEEFSDFVREHVVESLYRIRKPGGGTFEFLVDAGSRFATGQAFDTEQVVAEADRRAADWADIEQTISDMDLAVRMVRELRDAEVTVNAPTWRVLSSLEGGSSVTEIARMLGTTEFRAAREVAQLMRNSLIEAVPGPVTIAPTAPSAERWFNEPVAVAPVDEEPAPAPADAVFADDKPDWAIGIETPVAEPAQSPWASEPVTDAAPSDAWSADPWSPEIEAAAASSAEEESSGAQDDEGGEAIPASAVGRGGWWAEAMGVSDDLEVDTDEFLESVFSEAEGHEEAEEAESGFSMGLLRRRRMGPVSRDITDSD